MDTDRLTLNPGVAQTKPHELGTSPETGAPKCRAMDKKDDRESYDKLSEPELQALLKAMKKRTDGSKEALLKRLLSTLDAQDESMPSFGSTGPGKGKGGRKKQKDPLERGKTKGAAIAAACDHTGDWEWSANQFADWAKCQHCGTIMHYAPQKEWKNGGEAKTREGFAPREREVKTPKSKAKAIPPKPGCEHKEVIHGGNKFATWETCKECGFRTKYAPATPVPKAAPAATLATGDTANAEVPEHPTWFADTRGVVVLDSGCKYTVAGEAWHTEARHWLAQFQLTPEWSECSDRFRFGDGNVVQAICA